MRANEEEDYNIYDIQLESQHTDELEQVSYVCVNKRVPNNSFKMKQPTTLGN